MKKYLLSVLSALVLTSCVREWMPEQPPAEEGLVERTWTVAMDDGTRATHDGSTNPYLDNGDYDWDYDE